MPARTKLAQCVARQEGFGRPGEVPTVRHNPGDLRHSPHSQHPAGKDDIGVIDTDEHGWEDLERQLQLSAKTGCTVRVWLYGKQDASGRFSGGYAGPNENNTAAYLSNICAWMPCSPDALLSDVLKISAVL